MEPLPAGRTLPALVACVALALVGCASTAERTPTDPIEPFNRGVHKFNDSLDRAVLRPTAQAYVKVMPEWFRTGVGNFYTNLKGPGTILNQLLQGKFREAGQDTGRFLLNLTFGLGGKHLVESGDGGGHGPDQRKNPDGQAHAIAAQDEPDECTGPGERAHAVPPFPFGPASSSP